MNHLRYALPLLLQALSFFAASQPNSSGQSNTIDSLQNIIREDRRDIAEARALNALAANYTRTDMSKARACLYRSIDLASSSHFPIQLAAGYSQMVSCQQESGQLDSAAWYLGLLKELTKANPDLRINYVQAAGLFYKRQQNFKAALPFLLEALDCAAAAAKTDSSVSKRTAQAGANLNVGNTYIELGEYKTALNYHLAALRLFEAVGNQTGISFSYQTIGGDFLQLDQLQGALTYTEKALALKTGLKDTRGIATSLKQLGTIFVHSGQPDSALEYYGRAIRIDQKIGLKVEEMNLDLDIGNVYKDKKDQPNAELYFQNGKTLARQLADSGRVSTFDAGLIAIGTTGKEQQLTEQRLMSSLNRALQAGDKTSEVLTYRYLADHYANIGQSQNALKYDRKYFEMNDTLESLSVQLQLKRLEGQYNVEKKEQEIALLEKDRQLTHLNLEKQKVTLEKQKVTLEKQKAFQYGAVIFFFLLLLIGFLIINRYRIVHRARRAIELEKMRNIIARDLHDDIGSTLSSINILSKVALQSHVAQEGAMRSNLGKILDRSAAIMEKMDDIVWTINPRNDTMEQLLCRMKEFAAEVLEPQNINYSFEENGDLSSLKLDIRKRRDLYLLFKEAVNNAAKYSQCTNLHIRLRWEGDALQLEIADDGKGFAEDGVKSGNGLKNMRERAASMLARIRIDSAVGQGTRIGLDLPIT